LLKHIRTDLKESPWLGEGHRKVWTRLCVKGMRTSKMRVRRLMCMNGLLDPMWGMNMTTTVTLAEVHATVFVSVDHAPAKCVGIPSEKSGNPFEALEPIRWRGWHKYRLLNVSKILVRSTNRNSHADWFICYSSSLSWCRTSAFTLTRTGGDRVPRHVQRRSFASDCQLRSWDEDESNKGRDSRIAVDLSVCRTKPELRPQSVPQIQPRRGGGNTKEDKLPTWCSMHQHPPASPRPCSDPRPMYTSFATRQNPSTKPKR